MSNLVQITALEKKDMMQALEKFDGTKETCWTQIYCNILGELENKIFLYYLVSCIDSKLEHSCNH